MTLGKIAKHGLLALGLVCGLALAGLAGTARAESARLNMDAHLRARAGEKAPTVMKLKEGQTVRILGEEGRWLKVSYRGKVGYITRTQVDREESAEPPVTAARESRTRARDPKSNEGLRRQDKDKDKDKDKKDWDSLDDDATGEAVVEQDDVEDKPTEKADKPAEKADKKAKLVARKSAGKQGRKGRKKGFEQGMEVVTTAKAIVYTRASASSGELFETKKNEPFTIIAVSEDAPGWVRVKDPEDNKGWIKTDLIVVAAFPAGDDLDDDEVAEEEVPKPRRGRAKASKGGGGGGGGDDEADAGVRSSGGKPLGLAIDLGAHLALVAKAQDFTSDGSNLRAKYKVTNTAPAASITGGLAKEVGGSLVVGLEAAFLVSLGGGGIAIPAEGAMAAHTLTWQTLGLDLRGVAGYRQPKFVAAARVGLHRASVTVQEDQVAKLPSERTDGYTVGVEVRLPRITDKISAHAGADVLTGASLLQTVGLKDGHHAEMKAYYLGCGLGYLIKEQILGTVSYALSYETFKFVGASEREATATNASRTDLQHTLGVGAAYLF